MIIMKDGVPSLWRIALPQEKSLLISLMRECLRSQIQAALAGSGLPTDSFFFGGFLPVKSGKRSREFEAALERTGTSIFFESPYRILKSLDALRALAPDRSVCVARELTKKFETFHRGSAEAVFEEFEALPSIKGEITLLVAGCGRRRASKG